MRTSHWIYRPEFALPARPAPPSARPGGHRSSAAVRNTTSGGVPAPRTPAMAPVVTVVAIAGPVIPVVIVIAVVVVVAGPPAAVTPMLPPLPDMARTRPNRRD